MQEYIHDIHLKLDMTPEKMVSQKEFRFSRFFVDHVDPSQISMASHVHDACAMSINAVLMSVVPTPNTLFLRTVSQRLQPFTHIKLQKGHPNPEKYSIVDSWIISVQVEGATAFTAFPWMTFSMLGDGALAGTTEDWGTFLQHWEISNLAVLGWRFTNWNMDIFLV